MKTIALTAAALLVASASADARPRALVPWSRTSAGYERSAPERPEPAVPAAANLRPSFASHVSANGQGLD